MAEKKQQAPQAPKDPNLQRTVAADEIDLDPPRNEDVADGLERAAVICETRFAGLIGNMCAAAIREERAALLAPAVEERGQE